MALPKGTKKRQIIIKQFLNEEGAGLIFEIREKAKIDKEIVAN
jgi:hypothetical protein